MGRPPLERSVTRLPRASLFKPAGIPARELEQVDLTVDEVEALRLADLDGLTHEQAAESLGVSRQTVGRVLETARRKVADALVNGKALVIAGGSYQVAGVRCCRDCGARWQAGVTESPGEGEAACPACGSPAVRACAGPGRGRGRCGGRGPGDCGPGEREPGTPGGGDEPGQGPGNRGSGHRSGPGRRHLGNGHRPVPTGSDTHS